MRKQSEPGRLKDCLTCGKPFHCPAYLDAAKKYCCRACYFAAYHDPKTVLRVFWAKVDKSGPGGCWLWTSCTNERGYGLMTAYGKKNIRAHRFSWELVYGPTPSDRFCLHKCDVRNCVNPAHLFLGSYKENGQDMADKKRSTWGTRNHTAKLTEEQVRYVKANYRKTGPRNGNGSELARELGVNPGTVYAICRGSAWAQLFREDECLDIPESE